MPGTSLDCPHCGTKSSFFSFVAQTPFVGKDRFWHVFSVCNVCQDSATLLFYNNGISNADPIALAKTGDLHACYDLDRILPEPPSPQIAKFIPDNVEKPLSEAEAAFSAGLYSAAGSCYRKAIERSLKAIDPDLSGMLNKRIRSLEKSGLLPHAMIELLDQVRLFGNASMHEDDEDPTKEECIAAREFCHLFLTYAFTLPAKVELAKDKSKSIEE